MNETMQIELRTVAGARIRYAESGGPRGQTILLKSPWPESMYALLRSGRRVLTSYLLVDKNTGG